MPDELPQLPRKVILEMADERFECLVEKVEGDSTPTRARLTLTIIIPYRDESSILEGDRLACALHNSTFPRKLLPVEPREKQSERRDGQPEALADYLTAPVRFECEEWYRVKGRGWIATVRWPKGLSLSKLSEAVKKGGASVLINDLPVTVIGIEMFRPLYAAAFEEDRPARDTTGLLVRAETCPECKKPIFDTPQGPRCMGDPCVNGYLRY